MKTEKNQLVSFLILKSNLQSSVNCNLRLKDMQHLMFTQSVVTRFIFRPNTADLRITIWEGIFEQI